MSGYWRQQAAPIIAEVIERVGKQDKTALRRELRKVYPFGERQNWPYRVWLDEIKVQLGVKSFGRPPGHRSKNIKPAAGQLTLNLDHDISTERRTIPLTLENAKEIHGDFWTLSVLDRKDGQFLCYCCRQQATGRSSMNIWGTVCDFPTCNECNTECDGKRADSIPEKHGQLIKE